MSAQHDEPDPNPTDSLRERRLAHTDQERSDALAELRAAAAEFNRWYPLYKAASERREKAAARAWMVGFSSPRIGKVLGISYRTANRLRLRAQGEVMEVGRRYRERAAARKGAGT